MSTFAKIGFGIIAGLVLLYALMVAAAAHQSPVPHLEGQYLCVEEADGKKWAALETLDPHPQEEINALFRGESSCGVVSRSAGVPVRVVLEFMSSGGKKSYLVEFLAMPDRPFMGRDGNLVETFYGLLDEPTKKLWFPEKNMGPAAGIYPTVVGGMAPFMPS